MGIELRISVTLLIQVNQLSIVCQAIHQRAVCRNVFKLRSDIYIPYCCMIGEGHQHFQTKRVDQFPPLGAISVIDDVSVNDRCVICQYFVCFSQFLEDSCKNILLCIIFGSVYFFFFSFQGLTVGDVSETESQFIEVVGAEELSECRIHRSIYTFCLFTHLLYIAEIVIVAKTSAGPFVILICTLSVGLNYFFGSIHSVSPSFKSIHADLGKQEFGVGLGGIVRINVHLFQISTGNAHPHRYDE